MDSTDAINATLPEVAINRCLAVIWATRNRWRSFTEFTSSRRSGVGNSARTKHELISDLGTIALGRPYSVTTLSINPCGNEGSATFKAKAEVSPPCPRTSRTNTSVALCDRVVATTRTPAAHRVSETARPMPRMPSITAAIVPASIRVSQQSSERSRKMVVAARQTH